MTTDKVEEHNIVIVDDIPDNLRLLAGILKKHGYKVRPAPNGSRALDAIRKEPPSIILLDIMMPDMDGYEVCRRLKDDPSTRDIPVIFLSALDEVFDKVKAFEIGGVDYISKPFQEKEMLARINTHLTICTQQKALARQNEELRKKNALITEQKQKLELLATTDFLTGLANRRHFLEKAQQEISRCQRGAKRFAVILFDIDHFKKVNDTYGHECGDKVLTGVARCLTETLRAHDVAARWGGEEFVCLLPETDTSGAGHVAEKIRRTVENYRHDCERHNLTITVTLGVSVYNGSCTIEECIHQADHCLYTGKAQGRNQVVIS